MTIRSTMLSQFETNLRKLLQCIRVANTAGVELSVESIGNIPSDGWARLKAAELDQRTQHFGGCITVALFSGLVSIALLFMIPMAKGLTAATRNEQTSTWAKESLPSFDLKTLAVVAAGILLVGVGGTTDELDWAYSSPGNETQPSGVIAHLKASGLCYLMAWDVKQLG